MNIKATMIMTSIVIIVIERFSIALTANHVTKFSIDLSFSVHYDYAKIGRFTPILSMKIMF